MPRAPGRLEDALKDVQAATSEPAGQDSGKRPERLVHAYGALGQAYLPGPGEYLRDKPRQQNELSRDGAESGAAPQAPGH